MKLTMPLRTLLFLCLLAASAALSACSTVSTTSSDARRFTPIRSLKGVPLTRLFTLFGADTALDDISPKPSADPDYARRKLSTRRVRWLRGDYYLEVNCYKSGSGAGWIVMNAEEMRKDAVPDK